MMMFLALLAGAILGADEADLDRKVRLAGGALREMGRRFGSEIGPDARDRLIGPAIELKALRGKRVLLLGITAPETS
jgi:hypothetical protein